jgi:geranylgeranyl pyrophosphate synthase
MTCAAAVRPRTSAFDEGTAILVGDALQVLAFLLLADGRGGQLGADAKLEMIRILADRERHDGHGGRPGD